jgi:hypothetical protein
MTLRQYVIFDEKGQVRSRTWADYMVPTISGHGLYVKETEFTDRMVFAIPPGWGAKEVVPKAEKITLLTLQKAYKEGRVAIL